MGEVVYYTGDGGSHWRSAQFQKSCIGEKYLSDSYDARPAYAEMLNSKIWWISYDDGRLVRSVDGGHTWCDLLPPGGVAFYEAGHKYFMNLHFENPEHGWGLGWDRFLYETKDGGLSWTRITSQLTFDSMFFLNLRSGLLVSKTSIFRSEQ